MRTVLFAGLRSTLSRLVATGLAVVLAVAFVVATLTLSATFSRTTEQTLTADMANADVRITPTVRMVASSDPQASTDILKSLLPRVLEVSGVTGADLERLAIVDLRSGGKRSVAQVDALLSDAVRWQRLDSGAWPVGPAETTIDATAARSLGVALGDTVSVAAAGAGVAPTDVTVVGITSASSAGVGTGAPTLLMVPQTLDDPALFAVSTGMLISGDGVPAARLAALVSTALAGTGGIVVQTKDQAVAYQTGQLSGSASVLTGILLAFAIIALFVAGMVIANTFQVLVAQRSRELALLRCIGASTGQVRRLILGEAAIGGAIASVIGVLLGVGGAWLLAVLSRGNGSTLHLGSLVIDAPVLLSGFAIGVVLTVASALSPAARATRVRPVAAMRATDAAPGAATGVLRFLAAVVLLAVGGVGLVSGATETGLRTAVASAVVSFLGILLASSVLIPWIVRGVGLLVAWTSVPAKLASLNATRNPSRTGSTAAALLVGVTLVTMMVVGVTSVRESVNDKIDEKRPVDLTVQTTDPAGLPLADITAITGRAGVTGSALIATAPLLVTPEAGNALPLAARGVDPARLRAVARAGVLVPSAGTVLLNPANASGIASGTPLTVAGNRSSATYTAQVSPDAPYGQLMMTIGDLMLIEDDPVTGGGSPIPSPAPRCSS
jgi:putative ABC transport system permease protein